MKETAEINKHRPENQQGKGDQYLPFLMADVVHILKEENNSVDKLLWLSGKEVNVLAALIIEFGEDLHNDIGLWRTYENYNNQFLGTPLPLTSLEKKELNDDPFHADRIQHFLWNIYSEFKHDMTIPSDVQELVLLSERIVEFLKKDFKKIPRDSGVKKFLSESDRYGWDVKRKLVWLGTHSYFFRLHFSNYIEREAGKVSIPIIDDFINQQTSRWSGLGVIDILVGVVNIPDQQKADIKQWYERHASCFKVLDIEGEKIKVLNIVNEQVYTVMFGNGQNPFQINHYIFGSLVPYGGYWYWSGQQQTFGELSEDQAQEIKESLISKSSSVVYRYHHELSQKARERIKEHYNDFVRFFGDDLAVFPNGLTMAAALQKKNNKQYTEKFLTLPEQEQTALRKKYNKKNPIPGFSLPRDLLDDNSGLGVYCNPDEGEEIMRDFNNVVNGFKKRGIDLSRDEQEAIRLFVESDAISPVFVKKMINDYGEESLAQSFLIPETEGKYYIEYLLRRYKGHFYRNRYPAISFV